MDKYESIPLELPSEYAEASPGFTLDIGELFLSRKHNLGSECVFHIWYLFVNCCLYHATVRQQKHRLGSFPTLAVVTRSRRYL